jgi:rubrerythrin
MSIPQMVERIAAEVPARSTTDQVALRLEVEAALVVGAALPDGAPGALRLRTHRFIRGGWRFMRCLDPDCGRLYPMGEEVCECGRLTAPLLLCRSCGADALRLKEGPEGVTGGPLRPNADRSDEGEWILYDRDRFEAGDEDGLVGVEGQMRQREIQQGSFDPATCSFSPDPGIYPMRVVLAPARNRCLVCGGTSGPHDVLTPVALGTSAAVRVLTEGLTEGLAAQHAASSEHDGKERVLIFSDSRQDAAHQARFITYAGRYDRMRRRLVRILAEAPGQRLTLDRVLTELVRLGVEHRDNPNCTAYDSAEYLPPAVQDRARAWEEAPLLDDLAASAGYRRSVFNLGLVGVRYEHLDGYVQTRGQPIAAELGLPLDQVGYLVRCLLDEMRTRGALSRPMLAIHPASPSCPDEYRAAADWERRIKNPFGYPCTEDGEPLGRLDAAEVPPGITLVNAWRNDGAGGRPPRLERRFRHLLEDLGGAPADRELLLALLRFVAGGARSVLPNRLAGHRQGRTLLQVNAETVSLELVGEGERYRCSICNERIPWAAEGLPCPSCRGTLRPWPTEEVEASRYVARIREASLLPLVAGEHTAQVTSEARIRLEEAFKAPASRSPVNVLACSPTLEMGIDVGGLDAVVMRNIPPRPDNYAQRGGRAGRRSRVGVVLGYARSTPHDGYFFDKPAEMIAGEVPAPGLALANRDVVLRHLHAIAFGSAEPGLAGRMAEYVTIQGERVPDKIEALIAGVEARCEDAVRLAVDAWGPGVLGPVGLGDAQALRDALALLPARIRDLFERVRLQILKLQETIDRWNALGKGDRSAMHAQDLKRKLLGIPDRESRADADDRTSGHPMRSFAELGILPGYEFPSQPATLRLYGDGNEQEPVSVMRRFGIAQYQPGAVVHARGHRWRVKGLDLASPWNPKSRDPDWLYVRCKECGLRYDQDRPSCPRCRSEETRSAKPLPAFEYAGYLAVRDDTPVLQEEDRFAAGAVVACEPQRDGRVETRWRVPPGWDLELRADETIRWVNEGKPPNAEDIRLNRPRLHEGARGFYLCPSCGHTLEMAAAQQGPAKGRRKAARRGGPDLYGHHETCERAGERPEPIAIGTLTPATTLRLTVVVPAGFGEAEY